MKNVIIALSLCLAMTASAIGQDTTESLSEISNVQFNFGGNSDIPECIQANGTGIYIAGLYCYIPLKTIRPALTRFSLNGKQLWTLRDTVGTWSPAIALTASGNIYWATDARTLKVDSAGKVLWSIPVQFQGLATVQDTLVGINIDLAANATSITLVAPDGSVAGKFSLPFPTGQFIHSAIVRDGYLYIAAQYYGGLLSSVSGEVVKVDLAAERMVWRHVFTDVIRMYCDVDSAGNVYVAGNHIMSQTSGAMQYNMVKLSTNDSTMWQYAWYVRNDSALVTNPSTGHSAWVSYDEDDWTNGVTYNPVNHDVVLVGMLDRYPYTADPNNDPYSSYAFCRRGGTGDSVWVMDFNFDDPYPQSIISQFDGVTSWNGRIIFVGNTYTSPNGIPPNVGYLQIYDDLLGIKPPTPPPPPPPPPLPQTFALDQNYPNPFNPTTTISYDLPQRTNVALTVYDVLGQVVATLVDGEQSAGKQQVVFDGSHLASGTYFYVLQAGSFRSIKKMMLMK